MSANVYCQTFYVFSLSVRRNDSGSFQQSSLPQGVTKGHTRSLKQNVFFAPARLVSHFSPKAQNETPKNVVTTLPQAKRRVDHIHRVRPINMV